MSDQKLIIGYYRLSMEDDSEGESNSIINQRTHGLHKRVRHRLCPLCI